MYLELLLIDSVEEFSVKTNLDGDVKRLSRFAL